MLALLPALSSTGRAALWQELSVKAAAEMLSTPAYRHLTVTLSTWRQAETQVRVLTGLKS
jgi:hypothetical protein